MDVKDKAKAGKTQTHTIIQKRGQVNNDQVKLIRTGQIITEVKDQSFARWENNTPKLKSMD